METGISLLSKIKQEFTCKEVDVRSYSPLTLAFIGDDVYDIVIRTVIVSHCNMPAHELHKKASSLVKAGTQARIIEAIESSLSEEELAVYKRGRNAKSYTTAKNASVNDYRKATGLEALLGWLYLMDRMDRVMEIIKCGLEKIGMIIWDTKNSQ